MASALGIRSHGQRPDRFCPIGLRYGQAIGQKEKNLSVLGDNQPEFRKAF